MLPVLRRSPSPSVAASSSSSSSSSSSLLPLSERVRLLKEMRKNREADKDKDKDGSGKQTGSSHSSEGNGSNRSQRLIDMLNEEPIEEEVSGQHGLILVSGQHGLVSMLEGLRRLKSRNKNTSSNDAGVVVAREMQASMEEEVNAIENRDSYDLERKVVRQVEYYFGDYNLPRDKFMRELMEEDFGWIPMETMLTFKRLASISPDGDFIMNAIIRVGRGLIQVDKLAARIRRDPRLPLPENSEARRLSLQERTVFVCGFARDGSVTLDDLIEFFETNFEKVCNIRMRRGEGASEQQQQPDNPPPFLGSCLVTFATRQAAETFLQNKKDLAYPIDGLDRTDLVAKWQKEFLAEKTEFNDVFDADILDRTIWVHGFDKQDTGQEELSYFFGEFPGASIIRKRVFRDGREDPWKFCGAVFVTFEERADAEAFMALTDVRLPNGDKVARKWQEAFYREKGRFRRQLPKNEE